jgi:methyltransferase family protein
LPNPWLEIPLSDYEAHMLLPSVGQAQMLAETLEALVKRYAPRSAAILGCAGGNGLERLAPLHLERIVGVDINPRYVATVRERFGGILPGLDLYAADLESPQQLFASVEFIYAALVFEHIELMKGLSFVRRHCAPGGLWATVLQRRDEHAEPVSASPYSSLRRLDSDFQWVPPEELRAKAGLSGFTPERSGELVAGGGKRFALEVFRCPGGRRGQYSP